MGQRITHRSRPRVDFPFRYRTGTHGDYDHGPFTLQQIVELLWRVKTLSVVASITDASPTVFDLTAEIPRVDEFFDPVTDESVMLQTVHGYGGIFYTSDDEVGIWNFPYITGDDVPGDETIIKDGSDYWIQGDDGYSLATTNFLLEWVSGDQFIAQGDGFGGGTVNFEGSLILSDGVPIPLKLYAGLTPGSAESATCVITATEWFPYATTTGAAAWDTTTGAPANGGPGA